VPGEEDSDAEEADIDDETENYTPAG